MPLRGKGMLIVLTEVKSRDEADFNEWYNREHIEQRGNLPGFHPARRYVSVKGWPPKTPRYCASYQRGPQDLQADAPEGLRLRKGADHRNLSPALRGL